MGTRAVVKWDARSVKGLRSHLAVTQAELAEELGVRQQTVSEWETGVYRPRGASAKLLNMVADRTGFPYRSPRRVSDSPRRVSDPGKPADRP